MENRILHIKNDKYISVDTRFGPSFGGNQCWFPFEGNKLSNKIYRFGCGLIAIADLFLYLCRKHQHLGVGMTPEDLASGFSGEEDYKRYVLALKKRRIPLFPYAGMFSFQVSFCLNQLFRKEKLPYRTHFCVEWSAKKRLAHIQKALLQDLPPILIVGPNFPNFRGKRGVNMYIYIERRNGFLEMQRNLRQHFMVVTGIFISKESAHPVYLEVSSWGRQYYIDYEELDCYIKKYSSPFTSGLLYTKPLH